MRRGALVSWLSPRVASLCYAAPRQVWICDVTAHTCGATILYSGVVLKSRDGNGGEGRGRGYVVLGFHSRNAVVLFLLQHLPIACHNVSHFSSAMSSKYPQGEHLARHLSVTLLTGGSSSWWWVVALPRRCAGWATIRMVLLCGAAALWRCQ